MYLVLNTFNKKVQIGWIHAKIIYITFSCVDHYEGMGSINNLLKTHLKRDAGEEEQDRMGIPAYFMIYS